MTLIPQLKAAREAQGRSVADVAAAAGLHENTLRSAERRNAANLETVIPWASVLGFTISLLPQDAEISSASQENE